MRWRTSDPLPDPLPRERENTGRSRVTQNYLRAVFLRLTVRAVDFLRETVFGAAFRLVAGRFFFVAGLGRGLAAGFRALGVAMARFTRFTSSAVGLADD